MSLRNVLSRVIRRPLSSWRGPRRRPSCGRQSSWLLLESLENRLCLSTWSNIGPYGSPTHAIAIDPTNPDTIYTGSEGAGVRLSTDGGITWSASNTGLQGNALVVFSLLLDPRQPQTLYGGTFAGVYKSTDAGATGGRSSEGSAYLPWIRRIRTRSMLRAWVAFSRPPTAVRPGMERATASSPIPSAWTRSIRTPSMWAPRARAQDGTVGEGVFKSNDGGGHWSQVLASTSGMSVALDPGAPQIVYAGNADGFFKSYDGGDTWFRPLGFNPGAIASLVVDPSNTHTLYADTLDGGLFQSTDGAATWHASGLSTELILSLAVDPTDSNTIYAGTGTGPYVSHDDGATWSALDQDLRSTYPGYALEGLTVDPTDSSVVYMNSLLGGGFVTRDGGATWSPLTAGLASASPKYITFAAQDPNVVYSGSNGQAGPGGVFESIDGGQTWSRTSLGPSGIYVWTLGAGPQ